jgi:hypothetical protein
MNVIPSEYAPGGQMILDRPESHDPTTAEREATKRANEQAEADSQDTHLEVLVQEHAVMIFSRRAIAVWDAEDLSLRPAVGSRHDLAHVSGWQCLVKVEVGCARWSLHWEDRT